MITFDEGTVLFVNKSSVAANRGKQNLIPFNLVNIRLSNALYVGTLGLNLISTGWAADQGIKSHFRKNEMVLK